MTAQSSFTAQIREYTVGELSFKIKNLLEMECGYVRVKGEISGLKIATSGHGYLNLKDQEAILASTCWRPVLSKLNFALEEGMEVIASGKLTTYAGQSKYQLTIDKIEPAGAGALMQMLIERKARLEKEGLFDKSRKKPLPFFPQRIGIVTSLTGAVIKDMLHRIRERCPVHVIVWPCLVQGSTAAGEIANAIDGFGKLKGDIRPDVIIVARGGGAVEDLWAFNEEVVVRAVSRCDIPVISAVGHETDFTLTDFVADVRAPTPTAAAEFVVPILADLKRNVAEYFIRLRDVLLQMISHKAKIVALCDNIVSNPMRLIRQKEQSLDYAMFKLMDKMPGVLQQKSHELQRQISGIHAPTKMLEMKSMQLDHLAASLGQAFQNALSEKNNALHLQDQLLEALGHENILKRGFAIIKSDTGVVSSARKLHKGDKVKITMHDGDVVAEVSSVIPA